MLWHCKLYEEDLSSWCHVNALHLSTKGLSYIFRGTQDILLRLLLFSSNVWLRNWKMISKSGTRPSWPLVNVKLAHFIFSHLLFYVHTSSVSARSVLKARVCVRVCEMCLEGDRANRIYVGWELRCCWAGEVTSAWPPQCQRWSWWECQMWDERSL